MLEHGTSKTNGELPLLTSDDAPAPATRPAPLAVAAAGWGLAHRAERAGLVAAVGAAGVVAVLVSAAVR